MKIALISDLHFGVKKSNLTFFESQKRFFEKSLIPDLKEKGIKDLFILGDLFDHRYQVNVNILSEVYKLFKEQLNEFDVRIIVGNHDAYYKTTTEVNSVSFLGSLENVKVFSSPSYDDKYSEIFMVPWIADEKQFVEDLKKGNWISKYCFGHFEFSGFSMNKYSMNETGLDSLKIQKYFSNIYTGHYHKRSSKVTEDGIIQYIGSPYQIDRNDVGDDRGYTILDLETGEQEFVPNEYSMKYIKIKFPETPDRKKVKGNIVDVEVVYDENYNESKVQMYIDRVDKMGPAYPSNVIINNKLLQYTESEMEFKSKSIVELITEYVDSLKMDMKDEIKERLLNLYKECNRQ